VGSLADPLSLGLMEAAEDDPDRGPARPTREMIQQFLDQQAQELALRAQEVQVRQLEVRAGYRYSKASLDAQERELKDRRSEGRKKRRDQLYFGVFSLLLLTGVLVYLLQAGKDDLAREILKALVYIVMAGAGGFFAGKTSEKRKQQVEQE
jgi:hypothetical protein